MAKSFKEFLSESVTINGDFNGTLNISSSQQEQAKESFLADVVWEGNLYRFEIEGSMMSKRELAEHIQDEYPGAIVHNIYPSSNQSKIKQSQRYHPAKLDWV